jgi:bifunctional enzyme CysN/CysC
MDRQSITRQDREALNGHRGALVWLTGLSGAGKSTIAQALERQLSAAGVHTYLLDGDDLRKGLNGDLGFTPEARVENIRRAGEVGRLMVDAGLVVLAAFISPYRADRQMVRERFAVGDFIEVFVDTPLAVCEQRDPKGLYERARRGEIPNFTGISAPYEAPATPELKIDTTSCTPDGAAAIVLDHLHVHVRRH